MKHYTELELNELIKQADNHTDLKKIALHVHESKAAYDDFYIDVQNKCIERTLEIDC